MKHTLRHIALAVSIASVVGCSSYPESGRGGIAENYIQSSFTPVMPDEPLGPEHGLRFDWQLTKLHLDSLIGAIRLSNAKSEKVFGAD